MEYDQLKELLKAQSDNNGINYERFFRAILKRKYFIIISLIIVLAVGFVYLKTATRVYESTVLLKKEEPPKNSSFNDDPYFRLVALQSRDDITTEMALITTRSVLKKTASSLRLNLMINKISPSNGQSKKLNLLLPSYNLMLGNIKHSALPQILNFKVDSLQESSKMMLDYDKSGRYILYKIINDNFIPVGSFPANNPLDINTSDFNLTIFWPEIRKGTKLYFSVYNNSDAADILGSKVKVTQEENTNLIKISVRDNNPKIAQLFANTLVKEFMNTRTEQQRRNIQSSYASIDSQLTETSKKLKNAENNLSSYQSSTGLTNLDKNSADAIDFLSKLEAEKVNNDLLLNQYEAKEKQLADVYNAQGYFDQSYLSPGESGDGGSSAFSALLKQLSDLQIKRIELLQKETESHPDVVNLDHQIAQLKKQMSSYNQNTLTAYKVIINSLREKNKNLLKLIAKYQNKVQGLPEKETRLASLTRDKDVYAKVFNLLLDKREELRVKELAQFQDITVVDPASLPNIPVSPKRNLVLVLCVFVWGLLSAGFILIGEIRERKFLMLDEIEDRLQIPLFSIIPEFPKKLQNRIKKSKELSERFPVLSKDNQGISESYKVLRTRLTFNPNNESKITMFTSCEEHSGKTATVANLALSLISAGKKVLLIDADLKRCGLSDLFNISRDIPGLSTFLKGDLNKIPVTNLSNLVGRSRENGSLSILPAGDVTEESSELFQSKTASELIKALNSSSYDYILIDTPPITRVIDSLILGKLVNNMVMVVRYNYTLRDSVAWGIKEVRNENINIIGMVANACDIEKSSFKYKYGYGYGYEYAYTSENSGKKRKIDLLK